MAHLTDMEELLNSIKSTAARDYMAESMSCYMASAYRATIVLTFIALFDDILEKLQQLGKVNKKARSIYTNASAKRNDQEVFETYLIDQLKSNSLIPMLDVSFLEILRTLRNKSAHPSGHQASAEEARFVFFEAISRFLSKDILSTTQLVDELLSDLSGSNYFTSNQIATIEATVKRAVERLHPEAYNYLVLKVSEKTEAAETQTASNARLFLTGLARTKIAPAIAAIKTHVIEKKSLDSKHRGVILPILSSNPALLKDLDQTVIGRLAILTTEQVKETPTSAPEILLHHPAYVLSSIAKELDSTFVQAAFGAATEAFLEKFPYSPRYWAAARNHAPLRAQLLAVLERNAGSGNFVTANAFAKSAQDVESLLSEKLTEMESFRLISQIVRAARIGAWDAIELRNSRFSRLPKAKEKARLFLSNNEPDALAIASEILGCEEEEVSTLLCDLVATEDANANAES